MPAAWKLECLGELADISSGGTPRRDKAEYWGGDIPWVTTSQVDFCTINHADQHITQAGLKNSAARLLPAGTLLMALYGQGKTRGKVAKLGITAATNQACAAISIRPGTDENYVFHFLESRYEQIRNASNGGSQDNLSGLIVKKLPIVLPSLDEQRAIASALSDMDALLAKLDQLIAKKRDIKQAAMQELLTGRRRLPGFSDQWQSLPLGELFSFGGGIPASRDQLSDDGFCYLHYGDIHKSEKTHINIQTERSQIPRLRIKLNDVSPGSLLRNGDVVFVDASEDESGTSKHVVILNPDNEAYISGLHTIVAKPKNSKLTTAFKRFCFQSEEIRKQFRFYAAGTKVCGVSKSSIRKIFLSFPDTAEQDAIGEIFIGMDTEITALEARREKTRLIKQGMMQALLTGRVRLV